MRLVINMCTYTLILLVMYFHCVCVDKELMVAVSAMSLLRIIAPRAVLCTRRRYRFGSHHRLLSSIERTRHPMVHTSKCPVHYYADQYSLHPLQCRVNIYMPKLCKVHNFTSLRKPLLFTDDLLQRYIKQIVDEWNDIQKQWTDGVTGSGLPVANHSNERLSFLEPVVSKIIQHQQHSANIAELEDIVSGICTFPS